MITNDLLTKLWFQATSAIQQLLGMSDGQVVTFLNKCQLNGVDSGAVLAYLFNDHIEVNDDGLECEITLDNLTYDILLKSVDCYIDFKKG